MSNENTRVPQHDIAEIFLDRWSTRAYATDEIPNDVLFRSFEAARWAPSGSNVQPWRFIYSRRDSPSWPAFLHTLNERNQSWAGKASALIAVVSRTVRDSSEGPTPSKSHAFDAGAAWSNFAHQAHLLGWSTRGIGGFDRAKAREALNLPDDHEIQIFIAIGKAGAKDELPESLRSLEGRTNRQPITAFIAEGTFAFS